MKNPLFFLIGVLIATFSWQGLAQTYCTSEANNTSTEYITNITYAGINNTTTTHTGYNDFTNKIATVEAGGTNPLSVGIQVDGNEYIYAFFDWNQNGILNDVGEVFTVATSTYSNGPHTMPIAVPGNALSGNTRMRVIMIYDEPIPNPCGIFNYGEVEDYTVNVTIPSCLAPLNLATTAITTNTADIIWTENGTATEWKVVYGISGFDPLTEGATITDSDGSPGITLSGLAHSSNYSFYVKAICDLGDESPLVGPTAFSTQCSLAIAPWSENFDSGTRGTILTNSFNCWNQEYETTPSLDWRLVDSNENGSIMPRSGSLMAELRSEGYGETTKLVTPALDLTALNAPQLTFFFANMNWGSFPDELRVYYKRSASDLNWTLIPDAEYTTEYTNWEEIILLLPNAIGATDYVIAFEGTANYNPGINLDNISVEEVPSCLRPSALAVNEISHNAAEVSWTPEGVGTSWIVSWGAPGYDPEVGNIGTDISAVDTYQITGLDSETDYDVYIKTDCSGGDLSSWRGPVSFKTLCVPMDYMYENFDSSATGEIIPDCWDSIVPSDPGVQYIDDYIPASAPNHILLYTEVFQNPIMLVLPVFNNLTDGTHWLRFKAKYMGSTPPSAVLSVGYVTDANDYASFILIEDINITEGSYSPSSERTVIVPNTVPANARLAIKGGADNIKYFFDDVYWEPIPTCLKPKDLVATGKTQNTVDIAWTEGASETDWNISWGAPGYTPSGGDELGTGSTTNKFYQLTGLDPNTSYDIYVRSFCGIGNESLWFGPLSLRTNCGNNAATIPFLESFETGFENQATIDGCWSQESFAGPEVWVANSVPDFNRAPRTGNFNATLFQNNSDWLFYPVQLEAGINYELKFYARQYNTTGGTIEAAFGTSDNAAAMTTSIISPSLVLNNDYQVFSGIFLPVTAGTYYFGIKATLDYNPQYISIDDISVDVYQPSSDYFVTTWTTTTPNESITIPTRSFPSYSYSVDWENNGVWESGFTRNATHTYATPGTYTVAIRGDFPSIYFNNAGDKNKIKSIEQWGTNPWQNMGKSFRGCSNLVNNATDNPDLVSVRSMNYMFEGASAFNGDLNSWNVSNIKAMNNVFNGASTFNGDISSWNVSNVTGMSQMFMYASAFNEDIGSWDVHHVENMSGMFDGALAFNQDISDWNVSNVEYMNYMFHLASDFNQDISSWAVRNVNSMNSMFQDASSFNQNLGTWNVSNVVYMDDMFNGVTLSMANYDALLNGWNTLPLQNGVVFSGGNSQYCSGTDARENMINTYGWTITDGGQNCFDTCGNTTTYTTAGGWSNGDPDNSKKAVFADDYNTSLGNIEACGIEIISGVVVTVSEGTTIKAENNIVINGDLIFLSSATGNGELASMGLTSTIIGNATVQRYMKNRRSYRMVSSAVTTSSSIHNNWQEGATSNIDNPNAGFGTHITGTTTDQTNGLDGTLTGNPSMFTVNIATQMFEAIGNTDVNTLTAGEAYLLFVRGDRSLDLTNPTDNLSSATVLRATGSLATGTNTQNFATDEIGNIVMFGNPYQSAVNINTVLAGSTNLNTGQYYVYDSALGDYGAYVTVLLPGGTNTSGSDANQYLQPGQGGQVATLAAGGSSIVFNESDKAPGNFTSTNRPLIENDMLTVQLFTTENFNNGGPVHDSFGIVFAEGNNNEITPADAVKPFNFYENMGIDNNGTYLSLEQRAIPQAGEVYTMYTTGYKQSEYTLKVIVDGLDASILYLQDNFTGTSTQLEAGDNSYGFSVDVNNPLSKATGRFSIRTEERLGVNDNGLLAGIRLYPNPLNADTFYINAPRLNGEQLQVTINDLSGRRIFEQNLECQANTVTVQVGHKIASGVYLVTLKHGGEAHTYRLIKE